MVQFNFFRREVNCKIVYYGPGLSGKTTNLEKVYKKTPASFRGELTSIATEQDRTLFFDFMPIDMGTLVGMKTKLRLFTVPGQVFHNVTRQLVLQGADGLIFVADSQKARLQENLESLKNLEENLENLKMDIHQIPLVIQWNKRDMPTALPIEELERKINYLKVPAFEGVAITGEGVFQALRKCAELVLGAAAKQANVTGQSASSPQTVASGMPSAPPVAFPANPLVGQPSAAPQPPVSAPMATGTATTGKGPVPQPPNFKKGDVIHPRTLELEASTFPEESGNEQKTSRTQGPETSISQKELESEQKPQGFQQVFKRFKILSIKEIEVDIAEQALLSAKPKFWAR